MTIRILLADDHVVVRTSLAAALKSEPDFEVVGQAANGRKAARMVLSTNPDIVMMDVAMPEMNGIEATRRIVKEDANAKVIALSMHSQRRQIRQMFEAGAKGYLLKDCDFNELVKAIRAVVGGNTYTQESISGEVTGGPAIPDRDGLPSVYKTLSPREREILQLLAEGHKAKQIGEKLYLSVRTVENHRRNIMDKLKIHNVVDLTRYAIREGIATADR